MLRTISGCQPQPSDRGLSAALTPRLAEKDVLSRLSRWRTASDEGLHLAVDGCTFSLNEAVGGSNSIGGSSGAGNLGQGVGGAIVTGGMATITNSSFDHNLAQGGSADTGGSGVVLNGRGIGGAIANFLLGVSMTVNNCTFTDNQAVGGGGDTGGLVVGTGVGGGIDNERGGTATITNSTLARWPRLNHWMLVPRSSHRPRDQKAWMEVLSSLSLNSLGKSL